ncbi:hypothetical protein AXF42_Ash010283 [Apostasia shenzhenica]|uniref:UspA domain-containing protein n=1 Tax=Apostasia shenzhenica TaxID=1088818 RepID=A0A2I0BDL1_9ASPA|nr:hypothetical protein AXF42_Ash010283 [Apostasia shenzhenica]
MGRSSTKMASLKLSRVSSQSRLPTIKSTPMSSTIELPSADEDNSIDGSMKVVLGRKIMIVINWSQESKIALLWVLSHAAQGQDTIVLLGVVKPSSSSAKKLDQNDEQTDPKSYELLCAMKRICQERKPEVQVEICLVEGKEKGPAIVEAAKKQGAALLVLGQRKKRPALWRLLMLWSSMVEYCIKNARCMTVGVRKRGRSGGYLITTRKHKDFWLLA